MERSSTSTRTKERLGKSNCNVIMKNEDNVLSVELKYWNNFGSSVPKSTSCGTAEVRIGTTLRLLLSGGEPRASCLKAI